MPLGRLLAASYGHTGARPFFDQDMGEIAQLPRAFAQRL
jgi:hypothetical protein